MPCYRVMEEDGSIRPDADAAVADVDKDTALRMYTTMVRLQRMDAGGLKRITNAGCWAAPLSRRRSCPNFGSAIATVRLHHV